MHADGGGLYLFIEPTGAKRWTFIFQFRGKRKELGLGPLLSVGLADARQLAAKARFAVKAGENPIVERRQGRANSDLRTFGAMADQLIEDLSPGWKSPVHIRQWKTTLTVDAGSLRKLLVDEVTTEDVLNVLKPIWQVKPETASRVRSRIERVLDAAKANNLRSGDNPARWRGHLALLLPKRRKLTRGHHAALPYERIGQFMAELRKSESISARALEFTILTAARTSEVLYAKANEFNLDRAVWTVPADRMKARKEHRVPLSSRALEIVRTLLPFNPSQFVFQAPRRYSDPPEGRALSNMAMPKILTILEFDEFTVHGFRSTFKDWASDCTTFQREVSEAALAHAVGDAVERAYRRGDALEIRRQLMAEWAIACGTEPETEALSMVA
jgi:integrase